MVSFLATLKEEWMQRGIYCTGDEARTDLLYCIDPFFS